VSPGIALVNSDVELDERWLEVLWAGAGSSTCQFATGKILQTGTQDILDGSFDLLCRGGTAWRAGAGSAASASFDSFRAIQFCSATAAIFRSDLFSRVGLFEESFESYLEDVDLGLRCAAAGLQGGYFPDAVCWHRGSATFGRWDTRVVRLISRNQVFLIARHYPGQLILHWLWPIVVAQALWGVLAVRHGCTIAYLRGKVEGLCRFAAQRSASTQAANLEPILTESELQIRRLQSQIGFDAYWKVYFRLYGVSK